MTKAILIAIGLSLIATSVMAQVTTTPDTTITWWELIKPWAEGLISAMAVAAIAFFGWIAEKFRQKTGIDIDALRRESLQKAIENAAGKVVMLLGEKLGDAKIDLRSPAIKDAVIYVNNAAPDALRHFGLGFDQIAEKIIAKLGVMTANNPGVSPSTDVQSRDIPAPTEVHPTPVAPSAPSSGNAA